MDYEAVFGFSDSEISRVNKAFEKIPAFSVN
jgi:hypothetical protein